MFSLQMSIQIATLIWSIVTLWARKGLFASMFTNVIQKVNSTMRIIETKGIRALPNRTCLLHESLRHCRPKLCLRWELRLGRRILLLLLFLFLILWWLRSDYWKQRWRFLGRGWMGMCRKGGNNPFIGHFDRIWGGLRKR